MEIVKILGITPEEFLEGFQSYLKSLPEGLVVDDPGTGSHYKNYINLLISQNRDDKLDDLLK